MAADVIRSASTEHLDILHPVPDQHALIDGINQHVLRLERSAEELSQAGSDIGEEIQKLKDEQRRRDESRRSSLAGSPTAANGPSTARFSTGSVNNSIVDLNREARLGGYSPYSPASFMASPTHSLHSGTWTEMTGHASAVPAPLSISPRRSDTQGDGTPPLESRTMLSRQDSAANGANYTPRSVSVYTIDPGAAQEDEPLSMPCSSLIARQTSNASDTSRQAASLFRDFDGIHFSPYGEQTATQRSAPRSVSYAHAPADNMVYYPAPVPRVLNLPKRLSQRPASYGALHLPQFTSAERLSRPPPQPFFAIQSDSAVATLDSMLAASATAPVGVFTDHPFAAAEGGQVYAREQRERIDHAAKQEKQLPGVVGGMSDLGHHDGKRSQKRDSRLGPEPFLHDDAVPALSRGVSPAPDGSVMEQTDPHDDAAEGPSVKPATLPSEIQRRKAQQTARPHGIHASLPQLDAVAAVEPSRRRTQAVAPARECPVPFHHDDTGSSDDEDGIPLPKLHVIPRKPVAGGGGAGESLAARRGRILAAGLGTRISSLGGPRPMVGGDGLPGVAAIDFPVLGEAASPAVRRRALQRNAASASALAESAAAREGGPSPTRHGSHLAFDDRVGTEGREKETLARRRARPANCARGERRKEPSPDYEEEEEEERHGSLLAAVLAAAGTRSLHAADGPRRAGNGGQGDGDAGRPHTSPGETGRDGTRGSEGGTAAWEQHCGARGEGGNTLVCAAFGPPGPGGGVGFAGGRAALLAPSS